MDFTKRSGIVKSHLTSRIGSDILTTDMLGKLLGIQ